MGELLEVSGYKEIGRWEEEDRGVKGINSSRARLEPKLAAAGISVWSFDARSRCNSLPFCRCCLVLVAHGPCPTRLVTDS